MVSVRVAGWCWASSAVCLPPDVFCAARAFFAAVDWFFGTVVSSCLGGSAHACRRIRVRDGRKDAAARAPGDLRLSVAVRGVGAGCEVVEAGGVRDLPLILKSRVWH